MARSFRLLGELDCPYFVTTTIVNWLPIFAEDAFRNIVLDSLDFIRSHKNTQINAFVIMPSHLHAILWPDENIKLSDVMRDFKRFTSRSISRTAIELSRMEWVDTFKLARIENRSQRESQYQVWMEEYHPEAIFNPEFARQKLDYIHYNPVRAGLVELPEMWLYSSAQAYYGGKDTFPVTDILEI